MGVLNDDEEEQDKDDPSGTHHDDRDGRGQIGGPGSMCPTKDFGLRSFGWSAPCKGRLGPPRLDNRLELLTVEGIWDIWGFYFLSLYWFARICLETRQE